MSRRFGFLFVVGTLLVLNISCQKKDDPAAAGALPESTPPAAECSSDEFESGMGSLAFPYIICSATQLNNVRLHVAAHFQLANDIDLAGVSFAPIGNDSTMFDGVFDGNGHSISNWTYTNLTADYIGFFGAIGGTGVVKNVRFVEVMVTGNNYVGGVAGENWGTISDVEVSGVVNDTGAAAFAGGAVGMNISTIEYTKADVIIQAQGSGGGLVGETQEGLITDSFAIGDVTANQFAGGLVAKLAATGDVINCYSTSYVQPAATDGGLAGANGGTTITSSYWDTETSEQATSAAGTGKTTAQMKTQATFVGWDFTDVWSMPASSYPALK